MTSRFALLAAFVGLVPVACGSNTSVPELRGAAARVHVLRIDAKGATAEIRVRCGWFIAPKRRIWRTRWKIGLRGATFEWETNPANPAAGAVVTISRTAWLSRVRRSGWTGTVVLRGRVRTLSNGPSTDICGGVLG